MSKVAVEHIFTGTTTPYASYDSTKTMLGTLIQQKTGTAATDKFAGPMPIGLARPQEGVIALPCIYPFVISISSTIDWVFFADSAGASSTRRVMAYEYNKSTQVFTQKGFITLTFPTATNHTARAVRIHRHVYTTGTVEVSGTTVTGTTTAWQTARLAAGSRIGFGSTDPTAISTWYYVSAIGSETGITLTSSGGTISAGSSYVIEELRVVYVTTNATTTNGGLFLAKGVNFDDFSSVGTTIAAAISTDNVKAVYWLKDAATVTNTIAAGIGYQAPASNTLHEVYVLNADTTTTMRVFKYNLRAALTVASGASTDGFLYKTGVSAAVTGTISQTNNGRMATLSHGPGSGVSSIYFVTTTRVYRIPVSSIIDTSTVFIGDGMQEIPTGGTGTFAATAGISSVEYMDSIDRLFITTGTIGRHYITKYGTNGDQYDHAILCDTRQIDQSTADTGITPNPGGLIATAISVWSEGGITYICKNGTTAILNHIYAVPLGAHWTYAGGSTNQRLITPSLATPSATRLYRAYVTNQEILGSDNLGTPPEPYRLYARTYGISDNTGTWTLLPTNYDLTGIIAGNEIQLMFEFRMFGLTCVPARIFSCSVVYEDNSTDSHYQPSAGQSSAASNQFAWRFATAFGGSVPALRVRLYDAITNNLLVDDDTTTPTGTFERSTNGGGAYSAWNNTDKANETTYLRYTPASLGANITVRALLTQL